MSASRGRRARAASAAATREAPREMAFAWGGWWEKWLGEIRVKSERDDVRRGGFLVTNALSLTGGPTNAQRNAMYQLTHLNASHMASLQGLWAELAIRKGIQIARGRPVAASRRNGSPTTRYNFGGVAIGRVNGTGNNNRLNENNNITRFPGRVDYVELKAPRYEAERNTGLSPFNFVYKDFVSNRVKPWDPHRHLPADARRRKSHVTCFEKVRVDWNLVKIWCEAPDETLDTKTYAARNGNLPRLMKPHTLPARLGGDLTSDDVSILRSAELNIFPETMPAAEKTRRLNLLKILMREIFEGELEIFKEDSKGDKNGETDGQFIRAVLNERGEVIGWEYIDDELKISNGKYETYPAEDIQLLKKLILNCLYLNCRYGNGVTNLYIRRTRSFFAAFGIAAIGGGHIQHKKITDVATDRVAEPRRSAINSIATKIKEIFGERRSGVLIPGVYWAVEEVTPRSSQKRKLLAFPGASFEGIVQEVEHLRSDYDIKLSEFFRQVSANRGMARVLTPEQTQVALAAKLAEDFKDDNRMYSHARDFYERLRRGLWEVLGNYMSGYKKSAFVHYYVEGGGQRDPDAAWSSLGEGHVGNIMPVGIQNEEYLRKSSAGGGGGSQITGMGANETNKNKVELYTRAFLNYHDALLSEILIDKQIDPGRKSVVLGRLVKPQLIDAIEKFVKGVSQGKRYNGITRFGRGQRSVTSGVAGGRAAKPVTPRAPFHPYAIARTVQSQVTTARRTAEAAAKGEAATRAALAAYMEEYGES